MHAESAGVNPSAFIRVHPRFLSENAQIIMATIIINKDRCKACGFCIQFCPKQLLQMADDLNLRGIHYACMRGETECTGCAICGLVCPDVAIEVFK